MYKLPNNLPQILRDAGLKVVEVPGWQGRGRPASTGGFNPVGVLDHHTATGPNTSVQATLNLLIHGRSDLPGPLCQLALGRDGTVYVVAAGRANHAGKAKASGSVAAGDGNVLYIGIEAMNNGVGEPWPKVQYDAYALLNAVLSVKITHGSVNTVRGHKETSVTGKIDPDFDMNKMRIATAAQMNRLVKPPKPAPMPAPKPQPKYTPVPNKLLGMVLQLPGMYNKFGHLQPYARGNSDQGDVIDVNNGEIASDRDFQVTKDLVMINTHWKDTREFEKKPRRWDTLTWDQVKHFKSIHGGYQLRTFQHAIEHMKKVGLKRMEFEAKESVLFQGETGDELFSRVAHQRDKVGLEVVVKSLTSLKGCWYRLRAAHRQGLVTLVLPRGVVRSSGSFKTKYLGVADYYR